MLNVEEEEYIESKESSDLGFMVLVHHQDEPPLITEFGFGITTGYHYMMSMRMREVCSDKISVDIYDYLTCTPVLLLDKKPGRTIFQL